MMLLARVRRNGRVDLAIVLDEESIERVRRYDPAEVNWTELPPDYAMRGPQTIGVCFATKEELAEIERMSTCDPDWKEKAFKMLSRGFEFRPDLGDHDLGPVTLGKPTEGPKN